MTTFSSPSDLKETRKRETVKRGEAKLRGETERRQRGETRGDRTERHRQEQVIDEFDAEAVSYERAMESSRGMVVMDT